MTISQDEGPSRPHATTPNEKLDNIIKRLGGIERDLIDIREHLRVPRRLSGRTTLVREESFEANNEEWPVTALEPLHRKLRLPWPKLALPIVAGMH